MTVSCYTGSNSTPASHIQPHILITPQLGFAVTQSPHFLMIAAPEALLVRPLEQLPSERGESTPGEETLASTLPAATVLAFSLHIDRFVLIIPASPALLLLAGSQI